MPKTTEGLARLATAIETALYALRHALEEHGPACICTACTALQKAECACPSVALLCTLVCARARDEWNACERGPFTEICRVCLLE